jgi:hypothetical protein
MMYGGIGTSLSSVPEAALIKNKILLLPDSRRRRIDMKTFVL